MSLSCYELVRCAVCCQHAVLRVVTTACGVHTRDTIGVLTRMVRRVHACMHACAHACIHDGYAQLLCNLTVYRSA